MLVISDDYTAYHHGVVSRISERLTPHGYTVICAAGRLPPSASAPSAFSFAVNLDVAGVIFLAGAADQATSPDVIEALVRQFSDVPVVTVGFQADRRASVLADDASAMRQLVNHMLDDAERRNVVFLRGRANHFDANAREQVFREVMAARHRVVDESLMLRGDFDLARGFSTLDRLLETRPDIHVVIAANDAMARGAVIALDKHGLRVPEDVLVSGFDDSAHALNGRVALSTVRAVTGNRMERAADVLLDQISSAVLYSERVERLPGELLIRESSQCGRETEHPVRSDYRREQQHTQSQAELFSYLSYHEIIEDAHVQLAHCSTRDNVFDVLSRVLKHLSIAQAFVVRMDHGSTGEGVGVEVEYAYPEHQSVDHEVFDKDVKLNTNLLTQDLQQGVLVVRCVSIDTRYSGAFMYDPSGTGTPSLEGLTQSVFGALARCEQRANYESQRQSLERANDELEHMANFDALTGLANRVRLQSELEHNIASEDDAFVVLYFDLDGFKLVNDTLGHAAGDKLLEIIASRVTACVRDTDVVARLGGDEFAILIRGAIDNDDVSRIAEQLLVEIARPMRLTREQTLSLSASIGLARYPEHGVDVESLLKHADTAMYQAKAEGKNRIVWFNEDMDHRVRDQMYLDQNMRSGFAAGEFRLVYQPRLDLRSNAIVGVESLLRWTTAEGQEISPAQFIPVAETTGFIRKLDAFALETACAQACDWADRGFSCRISVNMSVARLQQSGIVDEVRSVLERYQVPRGVIEFEVTETVAMTEFQSNVETLEAFREMGIGLSIDDFGTAYSSLSYLKDLPIDCLKIDRSFLASIENVEDEMSPDGRIVRAVVGLGNSLGLQVVAEGVENEVQHQFLMKLGCDEAQGFLFARPLERGDVETLLGNFFTDDHQAAAAGG